MKIHEIMSRHIVQIDPEESVSVAARTLAHYNIGALPVRGKNGGICGVITDRDIVTRCLAADYSPETTKVKQIMTQRVLTATPDMEVGTAAHLMGREQVRRLPVMENGKLCGIVSLADMAGFEETSYDASDALTEISMNLSARE